MADTKPQISEETKKTMTDLQESVKNTSAKKIEPVSGDSEKRTPVALLNDIYKLMVKMREAELARRKSEQKEIEKTEKEEQKFEEKLSESVTGKKKKEKQKPKEPKKPKKKTGLFEKITGGVKVAAGAAVVAASVKDTTRKEEEAKKTEEAAAAPPAPPPPAPTPEPKPTPVPPAPEPTKAPEGKPTTPSAPVAAAGAPGMIASDLAQKGVSEKGQANVLAQVKAESNFVPKNENLNYTSAERIQSVFGKRRIPTLDFAQSLVNNPQGLANVVYAKTDGNSEPGDGFKYRGRGFLQHTGKNQYKAIAKFTGVDVVSDPDKLNNPEVAAKAVSWFFLDYKKKKPQQLDDISQVNKAVGFAGGEKEEQHRMQLAQSFASSGTQLASASQTNQDMKDKAKQDASSQTIKNQQTNVASQTQVAQAQKPVDDRPIWQKVAHG